MASEHTGADSIRLYHTGAAAHEDAQTDPDESLGNYRSSTRLDGMTASHSAAISNLTLDFVHWSNGEGAGQLRAVSSSTVAWQAPGGSEGPAVSIGTGETKILVDGDDPGKYVQVTRGGGSLSGTDTVTLTDPFNNALAHDNVSDSERSAGDTEYFCIAFHNGGSVDVGNLKLRILPIGTQRVSATAQLSGSGAGTITIASGTFADWPDAGFCLIQTSGGSEKEVVYYSSRTTTSLTVPSTGRAQMGTSATAGAATDLIQAIPPISIGKEDPTAQPDGHYTDNTSAGEGTAPGGVTFSRPISTTTALSVGTLEPDEQVGLWVRRHVAASSVNLAEVLMSIAYSFDAA